MKDIFSEHLHIGLEQDLTQYNGLWKDKVGAHFSFHVAPFNTIEPNDLAKISLSGLILLDPKNALTSAIGTLKINNPLLPNETDLNLNNPDLYDHFMINVYAYFRFQQQVLLNPKLSNLMTFHANYKYLLMAHNQNTYRQLGKCIGEQAKTDLTPLIERYFHDFMQAIQKTADRGNHTNALLHMLGYLKNDLPANTRHWLNDKMTDFNQGELSFVQARELLGNYVQQYGSSYLKAQYYFEPYPKCLQFTDHIREKGKQ